MPVTQSSSVEGLDGSSTDDIEIVDLELAKGDAVKSGIGGPYPKTRRPRVPRRAGEPHSSVWGFRSAEGGGKKSYGAFGKSPGPRGRGLQMGSWGNIGGHRGLSEDEEYEGEQGSGNRAKEKETGSGGAVAALGRPTHVASRPWEMKGYFEGGLVQLGNGTVQKSVAEPYMRDQEGAQDESNSGMPERPEQNSPLAVADGIDYREVHRQNFGGHRYGNLLLENRESEEGELPESPDSGNSRFAQHVVSSKLQSMEDIEILPKSVPLPSRQANKSPESAFASSEKSERAGMQTVTVELDDAAEETVATPNVFHSKTLTAPPLILGAPHEGGTASSMFQSGKPMEVGEAWNAMHKRIEGSAQRAMKRKASSQKATGLSKNHDNRNAVSAERCRQLAERKRSLNLVEPVSPKAALKRPKRSILNVGNRRENANKTPDDVVELDNDDVVKSPSKVIDHCSAHSSDEILKVTELKSSRARLRSKSDGFLRKISPSQFVANHDGAKSGSSSNVHAALNEAIKLISPETTNCGNSGGDAGSGMDLVGKSVVLKPEETDDQSSGDESNFEYSPVRSLPYDNAFDETRLQEKLKECISLKLGYLSLPYQGLEGRHLEYIIPRISHEVFAIINLKNNRLSTMPQKFISFFSRHPILQLILNANQFKDFPTSILSLTSLTMLDLSRNELRSIPTSISSLVNLRSLNLGHNNIRQLPENSFSKLTKLELLLLKHNRLRRLPNDLGIMTTLRAVDVSFNETFRWGLPAGAENWKSILAVGLAGTKTLSRLPPRYKTIEPLKLCEALSGKTPAEIKQMKKRRRPLPQNAQTSVSQTVKESAADDEDITAEKDQELDSIRIPRKNEQSTSPT